ncbi:hypothetical protein ACE3MZ_18155 [Paenibacillus sp. WLX1005]|uniref:hypothetical protein n=1 Tax=Paenibacillus sp. WLX1005 TaxID=3243766 RepID=UPI0039845851
MKYLIRVLLSLVLLLSLLPIDFTHATPSTVQQDTYISDSLSLPPTIVSPGSLQSNAQSSSTFYANGYRSGDELLFDWRYNRPGAKITRVEVTATIQYKKNAFDQNWTNIKTISFEYPGGQGSFAENQVEYHPTKEGTYRVKLTGLFRTTTGGESAGCVSNTVNYF